MRRILSGCLVVAWLLLPTGLFAAEASAVSALDGEKVAAASADAVQTAVFKDGQGNTVAVTTFANGSVAVSVNGAAPVFGAEASAVLSSFGIDLAVDGKGVITRYSVRGEAVVVAAPGAAVSADAPREVRAALPANTPAGSAATLPDFQNSVNGFDSGNSFNEKPVSR